MITERILHVLNIKHITKYKLCKDLNFSNGFLDKPREISTSNYAKILEYFPDINPEWLLTGKGEMLRQPSSPPSIHDSKIYILNEELIDIQRKLINNLESEVKRLKHEVNKLEHELEKNQIINKVPMAAEDELKYTKKKG